MRKLTPLHIVIQQSPKRNLLNMIREGFGRGKVTSSKSMESLSLQLLLAQLDDVTKVMKFEKKFKIELDLKVSRSATALERKLEEYTLR